MDFDSHTSDVVAAAVGVVNLLTPGYEHGREYVPADLGMRLGEVLRPRTGERQPRVGADDVREMAGYAGRLRAVFVAVDDAVGEVPGAGGIDEACALVNALLRDTQAAPVLARHDGQAWHLHFHAADAGWARGWAAAMATALAVVLGNPRCDRLGVCTATSCDRVFVDTSRNGTRRFCSTACQNRVKAAAFRARRRG